MDIGFITDYLSREFGGELPKTDFPLRIAEWAEWYGGEVSGFHEISFNNGISASRRKLFRLNMAKKVCEDWADMLLGEKTSVTLSDPKSGECLTGKDGCGGILGENRFWETANRLLEKTFALGTGAMTVFLENAVIDSDGRLLPSPSSRIKIDTVDAGGIFPVSWQGDKVTEVCFASEITVRGEKLLYLQIHKLEEDGYVIYSRFFRPDGGDMREVSPPEGLASKVRTGSSVPWFALFRPNSVNHLAPGNPLGVSVFADSLDILKGIDLCYDSMNMEFWLGRKMVFLRKDILAKDRAGNFLSPQELNRQLFMYIGDKNVDGDMLPKEFNPTLRVGEHIQALNQQLRCLSLKCGLGENHYRFDSTGTVKTATQVISENSSLYRTVKKHELTLEGSLVALIGAVLSAENRVRGDADPETDIRITFDDSVVEDRSAEQEKDLKLISAGIMLPWEFRVKYYGEDEQTAKGLLGIK